MTDQSPVPFAKLFESATKNPLPEPVQSAVENGLTTACQATLKSLAMARDGAKALSEAAPIAADATVAFTAKAFEQAAENTEAAFGAARAIVRAKSPAEAIKLHVEFSQAQIAKVGEQAKELFALSNKAGQEQLADLDVSPPEALGISKAEETASLPSGD